jgi:hypothetical protein
MTIRDNIRCLGFCGGLLLPYTDLVAQRLKPTFSSVPVEFVVAHRHSAHSVSAERGRCGRSSSPVVRGLVGAAAGAAAGYLLFTLNEKVLLWGGESTGDKLRSERAQFMLGMAAFGAALEIVVGPHLCKSSRVNDQTLRRSLGAFR